MSSSKRGRERRSSSSSSDSSSDSGADTKRKAPPQRKMVLTKVDPALLAAVAVPAPTAAANVPQSAPSPLGVPAMMQGMHRGPMMPPMMPPMMDMAMPIMPHPPRPDPVPGTHRVYLGNIDYSATEADVRKALVPFGEVHSLTFKWDRLVNHHKGFCFVEFYDDASVDRLLKLPPGALKILDKVCRVDKPTGPSENEDLKTVFGDAQMPNISLGSISVGNRQKVAPSVTSNLTVAQIMALQRGLPVPNMPAPSAPLSFSVPAVKSAPALTFQPPSGPSLTLVPPGAAAAPPGSAPRSVPPPGISSNVCFIENMVTSPGEIDDDLINDIKDECGRFGTVVFLQFYVNSDAASKAVSGSGADTAGRLRVAVEFTAPDAAWACVTKMNGRLFAGRVLSSGLMPPEVYARLKA